MSQTTFVVPEAAAPGPAAIEVRAGGDVVARGRFQVTAAGPGLFVTDYANRTQPGRCRLCACIHRGRRVGQQRRKRAGRETVTTAGQQ
jgi:uncharacterized protein (TIGR03437 family)